MSVSSHPSSFRDPAGIVIIEDGKLLRQVNTIYKSDYDLLMASGLYKQLSEDGLLVKHIEHTPKNHHDSVYKILEPDFIPFISYPYEWCFSQLKEAALLTLTIQLKALEKNLSLKDATAYNIQLQNGTPIFIDTLSFESYKTNRPWVAYGQFCRHFLGPLLLYKYKRNELTKLSTSYIDGIPLKVISESLPFSTKFNFFIFSHVHLHAKMEGKHANDTELKNKQLSLPKERLISIITHLKNGIEKLNLDKYKTEWTNYYTSFSYNTENFEQKKEIVKQTIQKIQPQLLLDLGCNAGEFSFLCAPIAKHIVAADFDTFVIEALYSKMKKSSVTNIFPVVVDINNPSPGIGVNNSERTSFLKRTNYDAILALALIHHLVIGNNMPFDIVAEMLSSMTNHLIIEFVPKEDPQSQRLLITKKDVFTDYTEVAFQTAFAKHFTLLETIGLKNSERKIYIMKKHA